jgi:hypothetical protein
MYLQKDWQELINQYKPPKFFRSLKSLDFSELVSLIQNEKKYELKSIIKNIYEGDIYQFNNSISNELINDLFNEANQLAKNSKSEQALCVQGVKNFFYLQKDDQAVKGGYKAIDRSYYFFPWNKESENIFGKVNSIWAYIKIIGGQNKNEYNKNLPIDGIINRIHIIQYMKGGGTISPHNDPYDYQKIQIGSVLNTYGKDFKTGGFAVFDKKKEKIYLEPKLNKGSLVCFFPSLIHTVDPIDELDQIDYNSGEGRWYLSLTSVGSAHLQSRKKALAVDV